MNSNLYDFSKGKSKDKLKVGLIGAGKMGLLHSGIFNTLNESTLNAIAENKKIISDILKHCVSGINIYQDYKEMLEKEQLDIVVITTPVFLHKKMIEDAMNHDMHIFAEKPLALNAKECQSILGKSFKNKTMVGYCRRFMETYVMVKNLIENEELGNVNYFIGHLFVSQVFNQGKGWLYNPRTSGGGVLVDLGSHVIDMVHYLFGNIKEVNALGKSIYNKEVEDYVSLNLKMDSDIFGSLQISWSVKNYRLPELFIEIHFEKGMSIVTEKYVKIYSKEDCTLIKKGWNSYYKQNLVKNIPIDLGGPEYTLEDQHFLKCIKHNKKTLCDFKEAAKTNFVIDKIYSSIEKYSPEKINYGVS